MAADGLLAAVSNFVVDAVFLAVNAAVIVLRRTAPDATWPFRSPGTVHGVPVLAVVGSLVAGLLAYRVLGHSNGDRPTEQPLVDPNRRSVCR